ncbi:MAG: ABC transporter ATP-binding protein [Verrucomicrobiales bacterium]
MSRPNSEKKPRTQSAHDAEEELTQELTRVQHRSQEEEPTKVPLNWAIIRRLFSYTQPHAKIRNWLFFLVLMRAAQLPLLAWAIGAVINMAIAPRNWDATVLGVSLYLAFALFTDFCFSFRMKLALLLGERVIYDLRQALFEKLLTMPMKFFHQTKLGRILSRSTSDVDAVRAGIQDVAFVSAVQLGQMFFSALLMVWYDWVLFSVVLALAPVLYAVNRHFGSKLAHAHRMAQESFSRVTATVAESITGMRVTQSFVRQELNAGIFRQLVRDHSRYNMGAARTNAVMLPLLELNSQFFIGALLLLGGYRALSPDIGTQVGDLVQFFFLANLFFSPVQTLGNQYNNALTAMAGAERVFRLLDAEPDWQDPPEAKPMRRFQGRVEFRNVTFGYDPNLPVLFDVDLIAEPGQSIALVGHTGSGKSSIINLLCKFYLPQQGEILLDGQEIRSVTTASWRAQLGMVAQQNFLFSGTLLDNLRVGKPDATEDEVWHAAHELDCADIIEQLSGGIHTPVGERGAGLSVGERQVVCFVRALLANPRLVILDEATASIDTLTEARLQKALHKLLAGRTSFVVAHRLSTIRSANQVLLLDHGRVIERGTHEELLKQGSAYYDLYQQFSAANTSSENESPSRD